MVVLIFANQLENFPTCICAECFTYSREIQLNMNFESFDFYGNFNRIKSSVTCLWINDDLLRMQILLCVFEN